MEQTKDYSLLRPFDLEAAKRGEPIMGIDFSWPIIFCGTTTNGQVVFVEYTDKSGGDQEVANIRMAPLAWVEGKPVYKGDTLYWNNKSSYPGAVLTVGSKIVFEQLISGKTIMPDGTVYPDDNESGMLAINLTWNKPKVKKSGWLNIYSGNKSPRLHPTKETADLQQAANRKACVEVFWEE